jgi:HPt (histidine-containing phosphotransfer) domain-containing protein
MPIPRTLDGFDVPGAVERMLGRPEIWWQALGLFVDHFSGWESAWQASIGDDAAERGQVHALGSAAANVGADTLLASARTLEKALMAQIGGGAAPIDEVLRENLRAEFHRVWESADTALRRVGRQPGEVRA